MSLFGDTLTNCVALRLSNPSVQRKQALTLCNVDNTTRYQGIETMRLIVSALITATIGLAASQASAADLPRKAPVYVPPAPPPITWTGCYIGANVGGDIWPPLGGFRSFGSLDSDTNSGFAGGGQIGCDYQFAGGWVIGFRNMFDGSSLRRDRTFSFPGTTPTVAARLT